MKRRLAIAIVLVLLLVAGVPTALAVIHAQRGYLAAEELMQQELWPQARDRLQWFLWLHPGDVQARLLLSDAFVKDEALPVDESAQAAIDCLAQIPDSSPLAAEARFREGGFWFLLLQKPSRAEPLLRRAIDLGMGLKAHQLLWTLLHFTGRGAETEEIFWRIYELTPDEERPLVLREWFLREFFPLPTQEPLDHQMLILAPYEAPTRTSESRRYLRIRERDPQSPASHAAVAQWCQEEGDPEFALRLLEAAAKESPSAKSNRFFLSVSIATHLDLGQFEQAEDCFRRWPEQVRDHSYWKWRAIILDDVQGQFDEALAAYDRALSLWPGSADWGLIHRKANCLARLRRAEEAAQVKERAAEIKTLLRDDSQARVRAAIDDLGNPEQLALVAEFYRRLGRDREADCWQQYIMLLETRVAQTR
jgi:tetratricopeptide (TPR) repeat protein